MTATATRTPGGATASATPYGAVRLEAEDSSEMYDPIATGNDSAASRCKYVYMPAGKTGGAFATYFAAPLPGAYQIWARILTPNVGANRFLVAVDDATGASAFHWNPPLTNKWTWVRVTNADAGSAPFSRHLSEGTHYVFMSFLRDGGKIDALEFVYQEVPPGRSYTPSGAQPCGPATSTPTLTPTFTRTPVPHVPSTATLLLQRGRNGYNGVIDTMLDNRFPTTNFGRSSQLYLRGPNATNALIRYDVSALPAGAQIISATLGVYMIPRADVQNRHQMTTTVYSLVRPFNELQATWFLAAANKPWAVPGVNDPISDFHLWPSSEVEHYFWIPREEQTPQWFTYTVTSMVQGWVDDPASNAGMIIKGTYPHETWEPICSSDYWDPSLRPRLNIIYYHP